ncbi:MAG: 16S rRNA (uracil(1498)-N(3))-methyltransferase [Eubacterium sp.]|nr:16S rRNA (uracil(1498)-N(3))-methyltransferase [Eubacterium sp.]
MYQFFIKPENIIDSEVVLTDLTDINHIKNVLRMRIGEKVTFCCSDLEKDYICSINQLTDEEIRASIEDINGISGELPVRIVLFQGLPKSDKMELIIQKAVELGAAEIVPVATKRCVVKLDEKKAVKKVLRWNEIAKSAAKQSKRSRIPEVKDVMTYGEALHYARALSMILIPYEDAKGISHSRKLVESVKGKESLGIFIGPEGGFEEKEVDQAREIGAHPITLGHRILRTETAGMTLLSILMFMLDEDGE